MIFLINFSHQEECCASEPNRLELNGGAAEEWTWMSVEGRTSASITRLLLEADSVMLRE